MDERILIVEDHEDIHQLLGLTLVSEGYHVHSAYDGAEGYQKASNESFDVIVLDLMLPSMNGLEVCRALREDRNHTPILMLTAKKTEIDRVVGLEMGADDYLTKPFSVPELQARIKALLRRVAFFQNEPRQDEKLIVGQLCIDRTKRTVTVAEREVILTAKEFDLLNFLATQPGKVYSREQLLEGVWGYQYAGYEHTVNSHINRLRNKVEKDPANPTYVQTVWGVGYKFAGE